MLMHVVRCANVVALCVLPLLVACDKKTPPSPPSVGGGTETIIGNERLGWDQRAADSAELAAIRYAIYVDGARSELTGVTCTPPAAANGFACSAAIPRLAAGAHTLELASFVVDGTVLESARSAALRVTVNAVVAPGSNANHITTADGVTLRIDAVSLDVVNPTDLAVAPDGRVFVSERGGTIRVLPDAKDTIAADGDLLALALDPEFDRTHFVYAIYTTGSPRAFVLARFRETNGTFGDRAVLLDGVRASSAPAAALRIGPDRKLYAAFDDGGLAAAADDLTSPNGKVLRLNLDGTTPSDQAGGSPMFASGCHSPRGIDWHPSSGELWVADGRQDLRAVGLDSQPSPATRGVITHRMALPRANDASALAFYRGSIPALQDSLLVASTSGVPLLRYHVDRATASVSGAEPWLDALAGSVHVVASAPDGTIYIGTANAIARLVR